MNKLEKIANLNADCDFFAAARLLQIITNTRLGGDRQADEESIRLTAKASVSFPPSELATIETRDDGKLEMEATFLGLTGPSGALPQHYTQLIIDRLRSKDSTLNDFMNVFNHRWLSLFYRAWEKNVFPAAFETAIAVDNEDDVSDSLWCLIGYGTGNLRNRQDFQEAAMLHYSGHFANSCRTSSSIASVLADWFTVDVEISQFRGQWLRMDEADQSKMGDAPMGMSLNNRLGIDTVVGSRIWNVENRFRVIIAALPYPRFIEFSPQGKKLAELLSIVRAYVGPQFDFDVQVLLDRREVPGTVLGDPSSPSQLGWNTWLGNWPHAYDAADAVFAENN